MCGVDFLGILFGFQNYGEYGVVKQKRKRDQRSLFLNYKAISLNCGVITFVKYNYDNVSSVRLVYE